MRISRDRAQAEDILQDVYVDVWRAAQSFDAAQSQPLTWLTSIARHRAIGQYGLFAAMRNLVQTWRLAAHSRGSPRLTRTLPVGSRPVIPLTFTPP